MKFIGKPSKGKVRNAQKIEDCGILFDSKLEHYCWKQLKLFKIPFELKPKYNIMDGFRYLGEAIRPITLTPDFLLPNHNIIVDTKGFSTDVSNIKFKLFKKYLLDNGKNYKVVILKNQKEVNAFIQELCTLQK